MKFVPKKGKDNNPGNEGDEKKKGMSKTEIQALMGAMMGAGPPQPEAGSPLMPNALPKGGKRGGPLR